ncbi:MAG: hypothetical protein M3065_19300 [Actinomycetota bacterium]|nr:hypothetical protein [Actinomycetota bacterium]
MSDDRPESGFQLYDVRVVVLNLPDDDLDDLDDLDEALNRLRQEYIANDGWAQIGDGDRQLAIWRGWITGGLPAAYLALRHVIERHRLSLLLSDPAIDVAASAENDDVVITGLYRMPRTMPADDFRSLSLEAMTPSELRHLLMGYKWTDWNRTGTDAIEPQPVSSEPASDEDAWIRPSQVTQVAPGQVEWDFVKESDCQIVEEYDPDGLLNEANVCFSCGSVITELSPPAFNPTIEPHGLTFRWRAFQYDSDADNPVTACEYITVEQALELIPPRQGGWVRELTRDAIEQAESYVSEYADDDDVDEVRRDLEALKAELAAVDAGG